MYYKLKFKYFRNFVRHYDQLIVLIFIILLSSFSINYYKKQQERTINNFEKLFNNIFFQKTINSIFNSLKPRYKKIEYEVLRGDTLNKIVNKIEIPKEEKIKIIKTITKIKSIYNINENQILLFTIDNQSPKKVLNFTIPINKTKEIYFVRDLITNSFIYKEIEKKLKKIIVYKEVTIKDSLYSSAIRNKIRPNVIIDFARIYGFQVDFQRDIWKNDSFQIIYERYTNQKNEVIDTGNILYANLILQGKENNLYIFKTKDGFDHFRRSPMLGVGPT